MTVSGVTLGSHWDQGRGLASGTPQQIANTATALVVSPQTDADTTNNAATVVVTTK